MQRIIAARDQAPLRYIRGFKDAQEAYDEIGLKLIEALEAQRITFWSNSIKEQVLNFVCHIYFGTNIMRSYNIDKSSLSPVMSKLLEYSNDFSHFHLETWSNLKVALFIQSLYLVKKIESGDIKFARSFDMKNFIQALKISLFEANVIEPYSDMYDYFLNLPTTRYILFAKKMSLNKDIFCDLIFNKETVKESVMLLAGHINQRLIVFKAQHDLLQAQILMAQVLVWADVIEEGARQFLSNSMLMRIFELSQGMNSYESDPDGPEADEIAQSSMELVVALEQNRVIFENLGGKLACHLVLAYALTFAEIIPCDWGCENTKNADKRDKADDCCDDDFYLDEDEDEDEID